MLMMQIKWRRYCFTVFFSMMMMIIMLVISCRRIDNSSSWSREAIIGRRCHIPHGTSEGRKS
jgi:hypothetical protein